ncbi:MAG: glutathione S-transferase family protein [Pseudomonadota bacterium]
MNTLYWDRSTAAFAVRAMLEEAGEPYQIHRVDLEKNEHRTAEYLALNPGGYVPTLITGEGQVLTESAAILLTLADRHPDLELVPDIGDPARSILLRWLFYLTNNIQSTYKRFYYAWRFSTDPEDAPAIKAKATDDLIDRWGVVEAHLTGAGPYVLGDRYSAVDIYLLMLASWFDPPAVLFGRYPSIKRCFNLVASRPAIARAITAGGEEWMLAGLSEGSTP